VLSWALRGFKELLGAIRGFQGLSAAYMCKYSLYIYGPLGQ